MDFSGNLFFAGSAAPSRTELSRRVARHAVVEADWSHEPFVRGLLARAGLDGGHYRLAALLRRVPACLRFLRAADVDEAQARLESEPGWVRPTLGVLLLGVTQFYRDTAVFDAVRQRILPELMSRTARVRIWSAACSDGPELYTVAMLLEEAGRLARAELLGTDCRAEAIERARAGVYPRDMLQEASSLRVQEHFVPAGLRHVQVAETLRQAIVWRTEDLLQRVAKGPWDLILWRNMAIYLNAGAAERLWAELAGELRPGGYLIAGRADRPPRHLGLIRVAPSIYRKPEENG